MSVVTKIVEDVESRVHVGPDLRDYCPNETPSRRSSEESSTSASTPTPKPAPDSQASSNLRHSFPYDNHNCGQVALGF